MPPKQQISILLVDDDPTLLRLMVMVLEASGYLVRNAANGQEAQQLFLQQPPDILVTDLQMPVMDGIRLVEWVRNQQQSSLPILVLTSLGAHAAGEHALRSGANRLATKPLDLPQLLFEIKALHTP